MFYTHLTGLQELKERRSQPGRLKYYKFNVSDYDSLDLKCTDDERSISDGESRSSSPTPSNNNDIDTDEEAETEKLVMFEIA